jgi:hypothetical protein
MFMQLASFERRSGRDRWTARPLWRAVEAR